jgi:hypothetical protein
VNHSYIVGGAFGRYFSYYTRCGRGSVRIDLFGIMISILSFAKLFYASSASFTQAIKEILRLWLDHSVSAPA